MTEFLPPLLERLGAILRSAPSAGVQAGALSAISSAAAAARSGFTPYARDALVLLREFMSITEVRPGDGFGQLQRCVSVMCATAAMYAGRG